MVKKKTTGMYQSLSQELEEASEGERLVFPFVGGMYDASNAALFYAHNGRLDTAQEKLAGQSCVLCVCSCVCPSR